MLERSFYQFQNNSAIPIKQQSESHAVCLSNCLSVCLSLSLSLSLSLPFFFLLHTMSTHVYNRTEVKEIEAKRDTIIIEDEEKVTNYYRIKQQLCKLEKEMQSHITKPIYCVPFLQPGRLVKVEHEDQDFGWGCVVNFQKKANQKVIFHRKHVNTLKCSPIGLK